MGAPATRWNADFVVETPGTPTPALVTFVNRVLRPVVRVCHRATLEGSEHLPATGPYILVANHSAGMGIAEILSFMALYLERVGPSRPLAGFAHPLGFRFFPASWVMRHVRAVPSTYEAAESTLAAGVPILVFPGGDHETLRPIWQAYKVDLAGRKGFLRIARKMNVPIVPMGIRGSHFTAPVLFRSRLVAWLLVLPRVVGLKRWALTLFGLLGAAAIVLATEGSWPLRGFALFAWLNSPFIFTPWIPWTLRFRIGAPLDPALLFAEDQDLQRAFRTVESEIQRLVDMP